MREPGEILIVSCYELGHQPLAAASALGFLEQAGYQPVAVDLAVEGLETLEQRDRWRQVQLVAISVPMHTALHIGVRAARRLRLVAPQAHICFYGLYAKLEANGETRLAAAVESLSDTVLRHLMKGHTKEDVFTALSILRSAGIPMRPSLVAFTPWTRLEDYKEILRWVDRDDLIRNIDPVQFSIRLLIPPGSPLAELDAVQPHLVELRQERFSYVWKHPDPRMDHLHSAVSEIMHNAALHQEDSERAFERIWDAAFAVDRATSAPQITRFLPARATVSPPRLTEPWFC